MLNSSPLEEVDLKCVGALSGINSMPARILARILIQAYVFTN